MGAGNPETPPSNACSINCVRATSFPIHGKASRRAVSKRCVDSTNSAALDRARIYSTGVVWKLATLIK